MTKPGRFCNAIRFWFLKCSILVLHSMKRFPSQNVTSIFLKPEWVKMGDLKGRQSRTLLEDGIYHLLEMKAAAVFHVWQSDGFRFSVPETEIQQFNSGASVILLTFFFFFFLFPKYWYLADSPPQHKKYCCLFYCYLNSVIKRQKSNVALSCSSVIHWQCPANSRGTGDPGMAQSSGLDRHSRGL